MRDDDVVLGVVHTSGKKKILFLSGNRVCVCVCVCVQCVSSLVASPPILLCIYADAVGVWNKQQNVKQAALHVGAIALVRRL